MVNAIPQPSQEPAQNPTATQMSQEQPQMSAADLVAGIHTNMTQLMELMDQSGAVGPEDKQQLASIIQQYQDFVSGLNQAPGQEPAPPSPDSVSTPEAGASQVRQAL